jgi:Protein of unknown function (DUF3017)
VTDTAPGGAPPVPPVPPEPPVAPAQRTPRRRLDPSGPVVVTVAFGVLVAALHHPRTGMYVACGGLAAGAVLRLVLSERNAGSLVVRKRRVDFVVLAGLALALGVLAAVTPFPAGQA